MEFQARTRAIWRSLKRQILRTGVLVDMPLFKLMREALSTPKVTCISLVLRCVDTQTLEHLDSAYNDAGGPRRLRSHRVGRRSAFEQRECCHCGKLMAWYHAMVGERPPSCQCNDMLTFSKVHCCREATSPEGYCPLGRCWRLLSPNFVSRWNPESCFLGQAFDHYARYVMAAMTDSYVRAWTHPAQETTTTKMLVQWLPHTLI